MQKLAIKGVHLLTANIGISLAYYVVNLIPTAFGRNCPCEIGIGSGQSHGNVSGDWEIRVVVTVLCAFDGECVACADNGLIR